MIALLVAIGALIVALAVRSLLDPWTPSPGTQDAGRQAAAEARAQMMQAISLSSF
jgi:hypothetical protein